METTVRINCEVCDQYTVNEIGICDDCIQTTVAPLSTSEKILLAIMRARHIDPRIKGLLHQYIRQVAKDCSLNRRR